MNWWYARPFAVRAVLVAAVAVAASFTSLANGYAYDDIPIIESNPMVHDLRAPTAYFSETYWGPRFGSGALYRPLAIVGYSVQWAVGDGSPVVFHAVNVVLYAVVAVLAFALLWQLLAPAAAFAGALLYAAHPVHVEAVGNIIGQAELWVALALLTALGLYARARQRGPLGWRTGAAIVALYVLAILFKEHGIVLPALLIAVEWFGATTRFTQQPGDWRRARIIALVLVLVAALYIGVRIAVLGDLTGDSPDWALRGLGFGARALVMLALVPEFARLLFWPARLSADYSPQMIPVLTEWSPAHLPGAILFAAVIGLALILWSRARQKNVTFAVIWFACTIVLVSNLVFASGVLIAERTLFLPTLGLAFALGPVLAWPFSHWTGTKRTAFAAVAGSLLAVAIVHSAIRQQMWKDNASLFGTMVTEEPKNFRGHFAVGEIYAMAGRYEAGDSAMRHSLSLYPDFGPARLSLARVLHYRGLCHEALPEYERVLATDPTIGLALIGHTACLVDVGRLHDARLGTLQGLFIEGMEPSFQAIRRAADSLLVATDSADARNRFWREGQPYDRTGLPIRVWVIMELPRLQQLDGRMQEARPSATRTRP